jgi:hypothetical protein
MCASVVSLIGHFAGTGLSYSLTGDSSAEYVRDYGWIGFSLIISTIVVRLENASTLTFSNTVVYCRKAIQLYQHSMFASTRMAVVCSGYDGNMTYTNTWFVTLYYNWCTTTKYR